MTEYDAHGRPNTPIEGNELETLLGFLDHYRATLLWKASGLGQPELSARLSPSTLTLGGLLKHMAYVEETWFSVRLLGHDPSEPWSSVDWQSDPDWDFNSAVEDGPEYLRELFKEKIELARKSASTTLSTGGLETVTAKPRRDGQHPSLRWIFVHMIEEYARHCGHADLIRESIDGSVGD
ncbi:MAG: DinB family protein [Microbacteriaceae bacterium]|nr:DinB family protein [Microbacteriaceae bacterium]